ncbi:transcription antiterminator [Actinomyces sp.]|uniref:BglG family transcription antiterminator n=1 Tax=Actinomyces sp. TaxID=29317 RepID=UPI0026DC808C|nr:PTS sugar transporter subunit IIA [Actinomyces sp.]MDO4901462.1 PTS sugar transporter subunit IIA [Actinomyces sp.]
MTNFEDLLQVLQEENRTMPSSELAIRLTVSARTIRNYVAAANDRYGHVVTSSRTGYRLDATALAGARRTSGASAGGDAGPEDRLARVLQVLVSAQKPVNIFDLADTLNVSESTIEADLGKARPLLAQFDLSLTRDHELLTLQGEETAQRRLMRRILTGAAVRRRQFLDVEEVANRLHEPELTGFKKQLREVLDDFHLSINEWTADELVAHIAVMVDRVRHGHSVNDSQLAPDDALAPVSHAVSELVTRVFCVRVPEREVAYLALLLLTKAAPVYPERTSSPEVRAFLDDHYLAMVTRIVAKLNANYLVDLEDDRFIAFLALHVRSLVQRAAHHDSARIPVGQSVKNTHPLVHELAVFIARQIQLETGIEVSEDEIGFIAFHVGGRLLSMHAQDDEVAVVAVVPRYYDVHVSLTHAVENAVAGTGRVDRVITDVDDVGPDLAADLIVTTVPLPNAPDVPVIRTGLLLTDADLERIRKMAADIAVGHKRFKAAAWLTTVMEPELFTRMPGGQDRDAALETAAGLLAHAGAVGPGFLDQVRERERLSTTAFASGAAIPHTIEMTAARTAIAVCLADRPVDWDGTPVKLIAMLCLSADSRDAFGDVFDAVIKALVDPAKVSRLAGADSYDAFVATMLDVL